jgi:hypothetical protein
LKRLLIAKTRKDGHVCNKNVPSLVSSSLRHFEPQAGESPAGIMAVEPTTPAWTRSRSNETTPGCYDTAEQMNKESTFSAGS